MTNLEQHADLIRHGCQYLRAGLDLIKRENRFHPTENQVLNLDTAFAELATMTQSPAAIALWADQIGDIAERIVSIVSAASTPPEIVS